MNSRTTVMGLTMAVLCASPCAAQWWWPPTNGLQQSPTCVDVTSEVLLTVSGQWPDNCVPNSASVQVQGFIIEITTFRDPPPGGCLSVISNWSQTVSVGPFATVGTRTVYVKHMVQGQVVHPRVLAGALTVNATCPIECYADCDGIGGLTAGDFICFVTQYANNQPGANCDGSTGNPSLTANDFACFFIAYAAGCS